MAVERQPGFEPQRIARAKTDRLDFGVRQQRFGKRLDRGGGDRNLKAILAGIARAADPQIMALPGEAARRA